MGRGRREFAAAAPGQGGGRCEAPAEAAHFSHRFAGDFAVPGAAA